MRVTGIGLLFFLIASLAGGANAQSPVRLFSITDAKSPFAERSSIAAVREYTISVNSGEAKLASSLELPIADGKVLRAVRSDSEVRGVDDVTWRGKISEKGFEGDVILTFRKGHVAGLIYTPEAVFEIVPRGSHHTLVELDQSLFPECGGAIESEDAAIQNKPGGLSLATSTDSGDRIDVLVVYTTATKNFLGGDAQAQTLSQNAIDATNTAYINSRVRQRVRMVDAKEWVYTETASASTDLSNLRNDATVQGLRNTANADLVAMIGEIAGACGVGYLMGSSPAGNPNNGYTVTARSCAVGNLSFAHELGHNMGSQHNPENGSGATLPYGYGHYVNGVFRTVMSYSNPCANGCTRRAYFSNPGILYQGFPTGLDNTRDNVRAMNNTADAIANYRYSGSSITLVNYANGGILPRGIARPVTWKTNNLGGNVRIEISLNGLTWSTVVASTPNDGSETVSIRGTASRRAWLRVVSIDSPTVSDTSTGSVYIR
jgi:peptidyl-Asp metalloendopeptidase